MGLGTRFNQTAFSAWLNGDSGRTFRIVAGVLFLIVGVTFRDEWWGRASVLWGVLPLSAGAFDICYISAALGGPLKGATVRDQQVPREARRQGTPLRS